MRELQIQDGYYLLDNNILACSKPHITAVFEMLKRQKNRAILTGGLEAKILTDWHAEKLAELKPERMYFAYDTPDDREPFIEAMLRLDRFGVSKSSRYCYSLCGYKGDTFEAAEQRMREIWKYGAMPFAMLYRDESGQTNRAWKLFQRQFAKPQIARSILIHKSNLVLESEVRK